jgi:uncharacterized protein YndB with AHSA1/START domain
MTERKSGALTISLPSDLEIVMSRVFDAPRELVFKAMTDPNTVPKWWGPRSSTTVVDKMDVRPGGLWRYVITEADGSINAFNGVFREITPPLKLVYTFEWEGLPGHIMLETTVFEEHDGKTTVTATDLFDSVEDRDGMLQSGMETGAVELFDRLEELLRTLG